MVPFKLLWKFFYALLLLLYLYGMFLSLHRPAAEPLRIISLVPSLTELLFHLGLEAETVGITKFCIHPAEWFSSKPRIGGTKTVDINKVKALSPTLIIANKEENTKEQVETLAADYPVWLTDVNDLPTALQMINDIGVLSNRSTAATELAEQINQAFANLLPLTAPVPTAYLIWRKPYMAAGGDTFINNMLHRCGFSNVLADIPRYPVVAIEWLQQQGCQLLLLSSEPYPFKQQHIDELQAALPDTTIQLVDGELFSWYGSRLLHSAAYFAQIIQGLHR